MELLPQCYRYKAIRKIKPRLLREPSLPPTAQQLPPTHPPLHLYAADTQVALRQSLGGDWACSLLYNWGLGTATALSALSWKNQSTATYSFLSPLKNPQQNTQVLVLWGGAVKGEECFTLVNIID